MRGGIFGWSYPPGAENDPMAPWNQVEHPCEICEKDIDDCECPECPDCGAVGDPSCYREHSLEREDRAGPQKDLEGQG